MLCKEDVFGRIYTYNTPNDCRWINQENFVNLFLLARYFYILNGTSRTGLINQGLLMDEDDCRFISCIHYGVWKGDFGEEDS